MRPEKIGLETSPVNPLRHSLRSGPLAPPRDLGRFVARVACVLFALIGLIPPLAGLLTRWAPMQEWTAAETARLLEQELGIHASYSVHLSLWPLALELSDVAVLSSDGGAPALSAPRVSVKPRLFSLLGGRIDAGQITIEEPSVRLLIRDGELANLALRLPEAGQKSGDARVPLGSVARGSPPTSTAC
jgi:translocation and assembly module TamB